MFLNRPRNATHILVVWVRMAWVQCRMPRCSATEKLGGRCTGVEQGTGAVTTYHAAKSRPVLRVWKIHQIETLVNQQSTRGLLKVFPSFLGYVRLFVSSWYFMSVPFSLTKILGSHPGWIMLNDVSFNGVHHFNIIWPNRYISHQKHVFCLLKNQHDCSTLGIFMNHSGQPFF